MVDGSTRRAVNVRQRVGEERRAATRVRILDAAKALLSAGEPMAVMTVARVAEQAGVSRATFYLHFPDKRELTDALTRELFAQWAPISSPILSETAPSREQLREVIYAVVCAWQTHAPVLAGLIEVAEYDAITRDSWNSTIARVADTIEQWLAIVRGELEPAEARALAEVIAWAAERSLHQMLSSDAVDSDLVAGALTELVWCVSVGRAADHA